MPERIGVVFGSGISDRDESLEALLNFCLLKGLPGAGGDHPHGAPGERPRRGGHPGSPRLAGGGPPLRRHRRDLPLRGGPFHYLNGEMVKEALAKKEFVAACDLFPTEATAVAGLVVPAASFAEKEGTVVSGDGTPRAVRKAVAGAPGGPEFLRRAPESVWGGRSYNGDELMGDLIKRLLAKSGRRRGRGAGVGRQREMFRATGCRRGATEATRPYRLILRDLFISHYLTGRESLRTGASAGCRRTCSASRPRTRRRSASRTGRRSAWKAQPARSVRPVTVKAGIKRGVLECFLFRERGDMLALSPGSAKVIEVSARKA